MMLAINGSDHTKDAINIHRVVLTGGPSGGKTTAQARLSSVFEQLGWRVYRVPEVATLYLSHGIKTGDFDRTARFCFQENIMKTMLQIEQTFIDAARSQDRNALVIYDRGFMDAVAYLESPEDWEQLKQANNWTDVEMRDKRYDHVIHMVTAADGAENHYTRENNTARSEPPDLAKEMDHKVKHAWMSHPCFDVIDNSGASFDEKLNRVVVCVGARMGIDLADRFHIGSTKRKWVVKRMPSDDADFPATFEEFDMQYIYLPPPSSNVQVELRRHRPTGSTGEWFNQLSLRRQVGSIGSVLETHQQLSYHDFEVCASHRDTKHEIAEFRRRCFTHHHDYFQLDIFQLPSNCSGLMLLSTYTQRDRHVKFPEFLTNSTEQHQPSEVTDDPAYLLYNLTQSNSNTEA